MKFGEDIPNKTYYTISDLSDYFEIPQSTLRHWESEFDEISPKRNAKGERRYSQADVEEVEAIHYLLKKKGHTTKGAKHILSEQPKKVKKEMEMIDSLTEIKTFLELMKNKL